METASRPPRLSTQLQSIAQRCRSSSVTIGELFQTLHGSPALLLMALLCLPFLPPVSPPGLSIPFGIIIALFGFRLMFGQKPILPGKFLATRVPQKIIPSFLAGASAVLKGIEVFSAPRLPALTRTPLLVSLYGFLIVASALLLMLPLPIPFANFLPALTILLFSLALIEGDGLLILAGLVSFAGTLAYFAFLFVTSRKLLEQLLLQVN